VVTEEAHGPRQFNSGWPITLTAQSAASVLNQSTSGLSGVVNVGQATAAADALSQFVGSTDTDNQYRTGLAGINSAGSAKRDGGSKKTYMAAASPWFFTHYGADTFNKNVSWLWFGVMRGCVLIEC
jgi:glucan endo-1,3-alpha-glucosidase